MNPGTWYESAPEEVLMGRSSTSGMVYLVKRPEGGFSYIRDLPVDLFPSVSGELSLSWSRSARKVGGRKVLKIALGTADLTQARARWLEIHPQVETLLGLAKARPKLRGTRPAVTHRLQALPRETITEIANRVYQEILAADDEEALSGQPSDLTELALGELEDLQPDGGVSLIQAKRRAHRRELDHLRAYDRNVDGYDFDAIRVLPTLPSLRVQGLSEDVARSTKDDLENVIGESSVASLLAEYGAELPHGHPDRKALALEFVRASIRGHQAVLDRLDGAAIATPVAAKPVVVAEVDDGVKLAEAYETWKTERKPSQRTAEGYRLYVDRFVEINGDISIRSIEKKHIRAYRDALVGCPSAIPKEKAGLSFWELHAWAAAENQPVLSRGTINDKAIGAISAILAVAVRNGEIDTNPCQGMKFALKEGEVSLRKPYDDEDMKKLLASPVFASGERVCRQMI